MTVALLYYRTGGPESKRELAFQKNLRFGLMAGTESVDLAPLTEWPWERVCAVTFGLSEEQLADVMGFSYQHFGELHWLHRPKYWTLLFIDNRREASWGDVTPVIPVRIHRAELADLGLPNGVSGQCVGRNGGRFLVARNLDAPVGVSPVTVRPALPSD